MISPTGRLFADDEAHAALHTMSKMLADGDWSLSMTERERVSIAVGALAGSIGGLRGLTKAQVIEMVDQEFIDYATALLAAFESTVLQERFDS